MAMTIHSQVREPEPDEPEAEEPDSVELPA
jgi:hypothetical protein